jgi:hypothetical protein
MIIDKGLKDVVSENNSAHLAWVCRNFRFSRRLADKVLWVVSRRRVYENSRDALTKSLSIPVTVT